MKNLSYREAVREALAEEMRADERVFIIGEDIGRPWGGIDKVTLGLWDEFGDDRVRNTPISENTIVGTAVGAAMLGMRPVVEIMYIDFITAAMDQIVNQAAKLRYMSGGQVVLPLVVRTLSSPGRASAAQHSQSLESWFAHVPGLKVVMPSNAYNAKGLLKASIRDDNPVIFIENKMLYGDTAPVPEEEYVVPLGKAEIVRRGENATLVAVGMMVKKSLAAAEILAKEGISVEIIDLLTVSPLDKETVVKSVEKTGRLVVAHEAVAQCGIGAEVVAVVAKEAFYSLDAPIERVASKFAPSGFAQELYSNLVPQVEDVVKAVRNVCKS